MNKQGAMGITGGISNTFTETHLCMLSPEENVVLRACKSQTDEEEDAGHAF